MSASLLEDDWLGQRHIAVKERVGALLLGDVEGIWSPVSDERAETGGSLGGEVLQRLVEHEITHG